MRLSSWRWLGPIPAALALQAVYGLLFADGVFVSLLAQPELTKAIGLVALFMSIGITGFGIVLSSSTSMTSRQVALLGATGILMQFVMAEALRRQAIFLLYIGAALLGIGSGAIYVVSIIILQDWAPESPGVVTGLGLLIGGGGTLLGIVSFQWLAQILNDAISAMGIAGIIAGLIAMCAACVVDRPPPGWTPFGDLLQEDENSKGWGEGQRFLHEKEAECTSLYIGETDHLLRHKEQTPTSGRILSALEIVGDSAFLATFVCVLAALGPGFGFVLAFPRMIHNTFGVPLAPANDLLFWVTLVGVCGRMIIGLGIDALQSATDTTGFASAKRVSTFLLGMQSMALGMMPILMRRGWMSGFAVATSLVYITFSGGAVLSACLARSVFSPENSTLAFALLGVAIGLGRGMFSWVVAKCAEDYETFAQIAFFMSTSGVVASYFLKTSKAAYRSGTNSPVYAELRTCEGVEKYI